MKSDQSNQTKPPSKDSEIEEVNHLDNDKELREQVLDILRFPNNKKPERFTIATQIRHKQSEELLEIIDQYTQSKLKAFAGDYDKALAKLPKHWFRPDDFLEGNAVGEVQYHINEKELGEALKAIKERWIK